MNKDNANELLPVVDPDGNVIGKATRGWLHGGCRVLHPVVHLHVFNPRGELFLQRRPAWKDIQPGKWDTAVGGHIDYGETVEQALVREAREEIGLSGFTPVPAARYVYESDRERELINAFTATCDTPLSPSAELDGGRFWPVADIIAALGTGTFTPNFEHEFMLLFQK